MLFQDRAEAGRLLAAKLQTCLADQLASPAPDGAGPSRQALHQTAQGQAAKNLLILAIPRGGVVVGRELAKALGCPLRLIITKKIGAPGNPELAVGAVGEAGEVVWNRALLEQLNLSPEELTPQIKNLKLKMKNLGEAIGEIGGRREIRDKTVILTDDGVATGATMGAAVQLVRQQNPKRLVVAVPVIARDSLAKLESLADEVVYLEAPELFFAVGQFYREFPQIGDEEVAKLLM
jgi:predicted phosphoribosyltransferase